MQIEKRKEGVKMREQAGQVGAFRDVPRPTFSRLNMVRAHPSTAMSCVAMSA
jgi:hypothetical protein